MNLISIEMYKYYCKQYNKIDLLYFTYTISEKLFIHKYFNTVKYHSVLEEHKRLIVFVFVI